MASCPLLASRRPPLTNGFPTTFLLYRERRRYSNVILQGAELLQRSDRTVPACGPGCVGRDCGVRGRRQRPLCGAELHPTQGVHRRGARPPAIQNRECLGRNCPGGNLRATHGRNCGGPSRIASRRPSGRVCACPLAVHRRRARPPEQPTSCTPTGESPVVPIVRFGHVAMPPPMLGNHMAVQDVSFCRFTL